MSTYWYFECLDHSPFVRSVDEFTQHTDDTAFKGGIALAHSRPIDPESVSGEYFERNARHFLIHHPHCNLGIINEYGERRDLPETPPAVKLPTEPTLGWITTDYENVEPNHSLAFVHRYGDHGYTKLHGGHGERERIIAFVEAVAVPKSALDGLIQGAARAFSYNGPIDRAATYREVVDAFLAAVDKATR